MAERGQKKGAKNSAPKKDVSGANEDKEAFWE